MPRLRHQLAGEYLDTSGGLTYLRARWYDPAIGRLLAVDPANGQLTDPRSLNRYAYAQNSPLIYSDPSGAFSLGEVGSALNIVGTLASRAYALYDYVSLLFPAEDAPVDGRPSLFEMLVATTIKAAAAAGSADPATLGLAAAGAALTAGTHGHHTIPVYMCGGRSQEVVDIGVLEHAVLHSQLRLFAGAINVAGMTYQVLGRHRARGAPQPPLFQVARTPYGRQAIASGLSAFYQLGGMGGRSWASMGRGRTSGHKLVFVLMKEAMKFATYNHTWPRCSR